MEEKLSINRRNLLKGMGALGIATMFGPLVSMASSKVIRFQNLENEPSTRKFLDDAIAEYEKMSGFTIEFEHLPAGDAAAQKVLAGIKAGRSYDIVNINQLVHFVPFADGGHLVPLTGLIEELGKDDFGPMSLLKYRGEYYYYPYDYNFAFTFYRKDWLDEAGLEPAKTWDDLVKIAKKFTKSDRYGMMFPLCASDPTNFAGTPILWANGVHIFSKDWEVILDTPQMKGRVVDCLELIKQLQPYIAKGAFQAKFGDLINAFTTGTVCMTTTVSRLIHHLETYAPNLSDKYVMRGFPTPDGKKQAVTHASDAWVVLNKGEYSKEAVQMLRWFIKEKLTGFYLTLVLHYQPMLKSAYKNPEWLNHPMVKKHADAVGFMNSCLDPSKVITNSIEFDAPGWDTRVSKVYASYVIGEMYQKVLLEKMPPAKAVEFAANRIREVIKN